MKYKSLFFIAIASVMMAACGGTESTSNSINTNAGNTNIAKANTNNPLSVTTPTPEQTVNAAPTLTPVVHAFYDALKNKNDAALKRVLSRDFIVRIEADMKDENRKDMAAFMAETDKVPETPVEVRNEKIQGDRAVAEIKGGAYQIWTPFDFINENGAWKFTGGSPALDNVSKPAR